MVADRVLVGFTDIAATLRTTERQVLKWVVRRRDPLRLRVLHSVPRILRSELERWHRRQIGSERLGRVFGWDAIAKRVKMSRFAAVKAAGWEDDPLPVHRPRVGMVWAHESALDDWVAAQEVSYGTWRRLRDALRQERARTDALAEDASPGQPRSAA
jgi:hypothetical protein